MYRRQSRVHRPTPALLGVALLLSCTGEATPVGSSDGRRPVGEDAQPIAVDAAPTADGGTPGLPQAGEPCPAGQCVASSICVGAICRHKCKQPKAGCNLPADECPQGTACLGATSFTDACFEAEMRSGEPCGGLAVCVPGNACVRLRGANQARCLSLCDNGRCPGGGQCATTDADCNVCIR